MITNIVIGLNPCVQIHSMLQRCVLFIPCVKTSTNVGITTT
ncbi:hypothetical protein [Candidatus Hodgkinia cicadicola]